MAFQLGQTIGDYEVIDLLDSSKKNVTYKVRNVPGQRLETLRVLPKTLQDDQERATRFLRESKVHARMSHPNIVTFYNATHLDGQLVMTTELVEGTPLAQRLELGPLPIAEALGCVSLVLSALAHAHQLGIVHRDITPSNIILTPDGGVKLTGFSLAKATTDPHLTQIGTVVGSLHYISPEQTKGIVEVDGRADLYSIGVVLYEAVTGIRPFDQKSEFELMLAQVNTLPPAPSTLNSDVTAELNETILRALVKDPSFRFQTAEEFQHRIDKLRGLPQPVSRPATTSARTVERRVAGRKPLPRRNSALLFVVSAVAILLVVLIFIEVARHF
jgi:serine/threonine protein kinase